jgi:cysteinyl-tRNA synthetase
MLTVNGQKMSKSLGNSFLPRQLFSGDHPMLDRGYGPMTVRFFMLQSHYSSTLDFSNEALTAAEKGFKKLSNALGVIKKMTHPGGGAATGSADLEALAAACYENMGDDFNTAKTLAVLFEMSSRINDMKSGNISLKGITEESFTAFKKTYIAIMEEVLGLREEQEHDHELLKGVIHVLIDLRKKAREDRNYALSDKIRDDLKKLGVQLMDGKEGEMNYTLE